MSSAPLILTTPRLVLRAIGVHDLERVLPLRTDPAAMERMLEGVQDRAAALETLKNFEAFWKARGVGMFTVARRDDDRFVGEAGIMLRPDGLGMALRYTFMPSARGHGFAREAVTEIVDFALNAGGLDQLVAVLSDDNRASQALAQDLGFSLDHSFYRGRSKMLVYSLTAEFWRARQKLAEFLVSVKGTLDQT